MLSPQEQAELQRLKDSSADLEMAVEKYGQVAENAAVGRSRLNTLLKVNWFLRS